MRITIAGYSFHGLLAEGRIDVFGYLETVQYRYGIHAADLWNGLVGSVEEGFLRKLRRTLDEREMTVANYHADGCHIWEDDPDARKRNRELAEAHLRAAAILGAETVRIDTGGTQVPFGSEQLDTITRAYQDYCDFGASHGFTVGPENHWGFSLLADNMETLANAVGRPNYGILLHLGHWDDGDEVGGDRRMAPWTAHTHVDARITATRLEEHMGILREAGYAGYWGVEHHTAKNEYREVAWQLACVQRVLSQWQAEAAG